MRLIFGIIFDVIAICKDDLQVDYSGWERFTFRGKQRFLKYAGEKRGNHIKDECEGLEGSTLPAPRSTQENLELYARMELFKKDKIWLGIEKKSNVWVEISSSLAINYTNWATNEPSDNLFAIFDYGASNSGNGSWFGKNKNGPSLICIDKETIDPQCDVVRLIESCQDNSILLRGTNCESRSVSLLSQNGTKCDLEPFADDCGNFIFKVNSSNAW